MRRDSFCLTTRVFKTRKRLLTLSFIVDILKTYFLAPRYHWNRLQLQVIVLTLLSFGMGMGTFFTLSEVILPRIFAATVTSSWNFGTSGDYSVSDSSLIEVAASKARLKVQNYAADSNTKLLLHLDESSGNPGDSSSATQSATATSMTYSSGKLNNAGDFNGSTSRISVADSSELSLTSDLTLEAWTKFNSSFSANSHGFNQTVIDKGTYQLYYDNETGKVNFELAPSNADNWAQAAGPNLSAANSAEVNGSWDLNGQNTVESQVVIGSDLYVGLGNAVSDAEVWKCTNCASSPAWTQIGGDGLNAGWAEGTHEQVASMVTDGTNIWVGLGNTTLDAEVWRWNGTAWTKVGGDGVNSSWNTSYEIVSALAISGTTVYAGLGNNAAGDGEVWRCTSCDGGSATWGGAAIGGDALNASWSNTTYEQVASLVIVDGNLVAGIGNTAGDGEVWSTSTSSISWTKRGGDGTATGGQSWGSTNEQVSSLTGSGSILYVGLGTTPAGDAEIWRCDLASTCNVTTGWTQVGGDGLNSSFNTNYERVWSLLASGTTVYAGIGESAGDAEVWKCTNCDGGSASWSQIGGDGNLTPPQSWNNTFTHVHSLALIGTNLFTGVSYTSASVGAQVWMCDVSGTCSATAGWSRVGGQYIYGSWGFFNLQSVESMTTANGKLYAGTGYTVAGNALVWEFDGSSWTLIGGQGINSSWTALTYELVPSMVAYNGGLVVGLASTAGDAEVWSWNGSTWTKIGGDGTATGAQSWASAHETVQSMAVYAGKLYVGLGNSANDAEVWQCTGSCTVTTGWSKVGGDSVNSGWTTNYETVQSMTVHNGALVAGIGTTAGDAEVWSWNGTLWSKLGGDGSGSSGQSWATSVYEQVDSLASYNGKLYAGLALTAGDGEVWECTGSCTVTSGWARVGGDGENSSWADSTYERVRSMATFNGELYIGLALTAGDGEVWKMDAAGAWTKVGGDGLNNGWSAAIENVSALVRYGGKLYAGVGETANADGSIWAYGGNAVLQSVATSQDTSWHHIAATYNGTTMKLYIDGTENNSSTVSLTMLNTAQPLLVGSNFGNSETDISAGYFTGQIDEVRVSNTARASFNTTSYTAAAQTVQPTSAVLTTQVKTFDAFAVSESADGGSITYRLSSDGGSTWKYYNSGWTTSASTSQANAASVINTNISTFPVGSGGILWQAILDGNGNQLVALNSVSIDATDDVTAPTNPSAISALNQSGGATNLTTNTWYAYTAPYFSWTGAADTGGSGIAGYYVYFGTDNTADPVTAGSFQVASTYAGSGLSSGSTYYLRIKAKDNAGNNASTTSAAFIYKFDSTAATNPNTITVLPAGYASTNSFTFSWAAGSDAGSGVAGYQYKTGAGSGALSDWSSTIVGTSIEIADAAYQTGENTFYLRTIDTAGNMTSSSTQVLYYYGGEGPSVPLLLTASPQTNTSNSFAFTWSAPVTHAGSASNLTYCYTVNTLPTADTCTFTSEGITQLTASSYATQVGLNTFYLVARNPSDSGSTINYANYASATFTANTSAPGIPLNIDIADISVKSSELWRLTVSWSAPNDVGGGISSYKIYRSTDDTTYTLLSTTTGLAYVDTGLTQIPYYYKVRACDSVQNCGAYTEVVTLTPEGKFTTAAGLASGPTVSAITTKSAKISWSTDRASDSRISYGKSGGSYFSEEPSNSEQVSAHVINLTNLSPGTTYVYKAKWTDEDGNIGVSAEKSFTTEAAPTVKDVSAKTIGLASAILQFTTEAASQVKIYYGTTTAFGGIKVLSTATGETVYTSEIEELTDGTKYFYKINTLDSEGSEYEGTILSFTTLPRPKISTIRVQQIRGSAQPSALITWSTNTDVSSIVTYYPEGKPAEAKDEVNVALTTGAHRMIIKGLFPQTTYVLQVKGRDKAGNEAVSELQRITTATDTRPPQVTDLKVEGSTSVTSSSQGQNANTQLIVSWDTDEPSTSQVEFGEGTGTTYAQKTQEDASLTSNHVVIISGLTPSKVYHLRALSKDSANNIGESIDTVTITPKEQDSALNLVITNLSQVFGFLGGLKR